MVNTTIDADAYQRIAIERHDQILVLRLNNPERSNAVDDRMHSELSTVFLDAQNDADSRVVVLTGAGTCFSVGGDTSADRQFTSASGRSVFEEAQAIVESALALEKPLIAAVNGDAIGLGATLASLADISFMEQRGQFGDPHVWAALPAGNGSALIWPLLVGPNRAKELLMTGAILSAADAAGEGLVSHAVPDGTALDEALRMGTTLAAFAPQAVQGTKAAVNHSVRLVAALTLPVSLAAEEQAMQHPDFHAAMETLRPR